LPPSERRDNINVKAVFIVIPGRCEASNPESRDSGSGPSDHPAMTDGFVPDAMKATRRANQQFPVHPLLKKYSAFPVGQITSTSSPVSRPQEGRIAIVTKREAGCDGRGGARDERANAYGEVVWSCAPTLASSS
jgi:hypothetical protein